LIELKKQQGDIMLSITKKDFVLQRKNFQLQNPWNILRLIAGAFFIPHALSKVVNGALNPGIVGFFDKAGFHPPEFWVTLAFLAEMVCGIALILGICTRFAALGAGFTLLIAVYALQVVKGFGWLWNFGGYEYPVFWAIVCFSVSIHAFQERR